MKDCSEVALMKPLDNPVEDLKAIVATTTNAIRVAEGLTIELKLLRSIAQEIVNESED